MIAMCSSARVAQRRRFKTLFCSRPKNDSMAALSPAAPTRPIDPTRSWRRSSAKNFLERNCDPRSECSGMMRSALKHDLHGVGGGEHHHLRGGEDRDVVELA